MLGYSIQQKLSAGDMIAQEAKYSAWLLYTVVPTPM